MSKEMTYTLCYTPNKNKSSEPVNYVCSDGKIHVRFRDFDRPQVVKGFEKKLTYLITYLMNYSYLPSIIGEYDTKTIIEGFIKSFDLAAVYDAVNVNIHNSSFKGFNVNKNYKKSNLKVFGNVDDRCFPLQTTESGVIKSGSLGIFLETIKISLSDYLFNDNYFLVIHEEKDYNSDAKFINKELRKTNRRQIVSNLEELW